MQLIFDNLAATLMASIISLILLAAMLQAQEVQFEVLAYERMRTQQVAFIDILERDLGSLTSVEDVEAHPPSSPAISAASIFSFYVRYADQDAADSTKISYRYKKVGQRAGQDLYRVERYEHPVPASVPPSAKRAGGSMSTLTGWSIRGLNEQDQPASNPLDVSQIKVRFETLTPFGNETARFYRWSTRFYPAMLKKDVI